MDTAQFRTDLPEFADTATYPDAQVNLYLNLAALVLPAARWCDYLNLGLELFTAHNIVLDRQGVVIAAAGGIPGVASGVVSAKSVGQMSISYDTAAGIEKDAGHWNLTVYGRRFFRLMGMIGMGGVYL